MKVEESYTLGSYSARKYSHPHPGVVDRQHQPLSKTTWTACQTLGNSGSFSSSEQHALRAELIAEKQRRTRVTWSTGSALGSFGEGTERDSGARVGTGEGARGSLGKEKS